MSRGAELGAQAVAMRDKKGFMSIFGIGKEQQQEDAAELFTKSGNAYKGSNEHNWAANMFEEAAKCYMSAGSKLDAVRSTIEAGNCYKRVS